MTDTPSCSLDPDAFAARMAEWGGLDHAVLSRRATPTGAEVRYRLEPGLAERLLDLVRAEAACCPGLTFEATVVLAITAPREMRDPLLGVVAPD
jgi:hypothetical protein